MNLCLHAKKPPITQFCSKDIIDLKILQSHWARELWPVSHEPNFSQIRDVQRLANNMNFRYTANSEKFKDQIFQSIQKTFFWPI